MPNGKVLTTARNDVARFISRGGFEVPVTFKSPSGLIAQVGCLTPITHITVETDGQIQLGKNMRLTVPEAELRKAGYPIRDENQIVNLKGHLVTWTDANNITKTYSVVEQHPDEFLGTITCLCGEREINT